MPVDRKDVERALAKKGFVLEERAHRFYFLWVDGKKTGIFAFISTGTGYKQYKDPLVAKLAQELRLSKADFLRLVECQLDGPGYVALLRESGVKV